MIVTAPHHGSEANANAYRRFRRDAPNSTSTVWARSDGRYASRPGPSFLGLRASNVPAYCTLCRQTRMQKQDLVFAPSGCRWRPVNTRSCSCQ